MSGDASRSCSPSARSAQSREAICASEPGATLGIRGPVRHRVADRRARRCRRDRRRGRHRPRAAATGRPPRPRAPRRVRARSPSSTAPGHRRTCSTRAELERWRATAYVDTTVDAAGPEWTGKVGFVPKLLSAARFDADSAVAFVCGPEIMMRFSADALVERGVAPERIYVSLERNMRCGARPLRPLPARPDAHLPRRSRLHVRRPRSPGSRFASCERGTRQAEARGLEVRVLRRLPADSARLRGRAPRARRTRSRSPTSSRRRAARWRARTTSRSSRARSRPSTTPSGSSGCAPRRRRSSRSAPARRPAGSRPCATSATSRSSPRSSTPRPQYLSTLATSTPISAHVPVDFELHGCPIDKRQLVEVITAFLHGRRPGIPSTSVCTECKRRGTVCVMVAHGTPCLGPVTHAGCGALCPSYNRGCYGCFGPKETPNTVSLTRQLTRARHGRAGDRQGLPHLQHGGSGLPGGACR